MSEETRQQRRQRERLAKKQVPGIVTLSRADYIGQSDITAMQKLYRGSKRYPYAGAKRSGRNE